MHIKRLFMKIDNKLDNKYDIWYSVPLCGCFPIYHFSQVISAVDIYIYIYMYIYIYQGIKNYTYLFDIASLGYQNPNCSVFVLSLVKYRQLDPWAPDIAIFIPANPSRADWGRASGPKSLKARYCVFIEECLQRSITLWMNQCFTRENH